MCLPEQEDLEAERRREERLRQQQIAPWQAEEPEAPKVRQDRRQAVDATAAAAHGVCGDGGPRRW